MDDPPPLPVEAMIVRNMFKLRLCFLPMKCILYDAVEAMIVRNMFKLRLCFLPMKCILYDAVTAAF
jgi:hypothetical protein